MWTSQVIEIAKIIGISKVVGLAGVTKRTVSNFRGSGHLGREKWPEGEMPGMQMLPEGHAASAARTSVIP
jgi:hypothetical protein